MRLGLVTYNLARSWDVETTIRTCQDTGFEGVELRTTHAHGVEVELGAGQRAEVRTRFAGSGVALVGLGSAFEFDSPDPAELRRNVEGTKAYVQLAQDVGAGGVKVRPNRLHEAEGVPRARTLEQIGLALRECGAFAQDCGVEIRLEVHGRDTADPANIRAILDHADHPNVHACWNSNPGEVIDGSIDAGFALLRGRIRLVHINELCTAYPWRRLFALLRHSGYAGFTLAEVPESPEPVRFMHYYRALWLALQHPEG
ncbi:MAG: TIM barrel protein [Candidatus Latescibacterota bacterium]